MLTVKAILENLHNETRESAHNHFAEAGLYYLVLSAWHDNNGDPFAAAYFQEKSAAMYEYALGILGSSDREWKRQQRISRQFAEANRAARGARKYRRIATVQQAVYA